MDGSLSSSLLAADEEREQQIAQVRSWGGANSDAVLDPLSNAFYSKGIEGFIGYRAVNDSLVVIGEPIAPVESQLQLVEAFHEACHQKGKLPLYVGASDALRSLLMGRYCQVSLEFGYELQLDPHDDPKAKSGVYASLLRRKVRQAQKEGVAVMEYRADLAASLEEQLVQVGERWLARRQGPQIHLSHPRLFQERLGKRWFYAQVDGEPCGVVQLHQIATFEGWLINYLMVDESAPHGTPELLISEVLEQLASEGCHWASFGYVAGEELGSINGLGSLQSWFIRNLFQLARHLFPMVGSSKFWKKFAPRKSSSYLLFSRSHLGLKEMKALKQALNVSLR